MSMSALINSADCGPINPLQGLSKQLDRDRGLQQDHFGSSSQAGPSRLGGFRSAPSSTPQSAQFAREANQFFSNVQSTPEVSQARPFTPSMIAGPSRSLHALDPSARAMTPTEAWKMDGPIASGSRVMQNPAVSRAASDWALDFNVIGQREQNSAPMLQSSQPSLGYQPYSPMNMGASQYSSPIQWNEVAKASINSQPNQINAAPDWAAQFANIEEQTQEPAATTSEPTSSAVVVDDLAAAAGLLVSSMSHEKSDKFKNSEFMGLMRRLRDREAIVDGQTIIETSQSGATASPLDLGKSWTDEFASTTSLDKGKGRAVDPIPTTTANAFTPTAGYGFTQGRPPYIPSPLATSASAPLQQAADDVLSRYMNELGLEEEDPAALLGKDYNLASDRYSELYANMGKMQASMDELDYERQLAEMNEMLGESRYSELGERSSGYQFQANNPYLSMHSVPQEIQHLPYQSVLQTEALVQRSPEDAGLWFQLGVKQQENEQEDKAVEALQKALQLDPTHAAALLALAVSQTNENNRVGALEAIEQWIDIQGRGEYADAISRHRALNGEVKKELEAGASMRGQMAARQKDLLECLMTMARMSPDGAIDADVQIALGILLNSSEDYDMAKDCFQSALSVRPDEPQLYNRVGATLANSGRASEALAYYYRALELNPSYIRARFNLGISSVNLSMYEEAAGHFLDALVLQDLDANEGQNTGGISSSALWDSLRATCLHLQRPDLVALCDARDLPTFREIFSAPSGAPLEF